jgi:hypothetical protein
MRRSVPIRTSRERVLRSQGLRQRGSQGFHSATEKSGCSPQNSAPARRAVALQFALRKNQRKTVTCRKDSQSARRFRSGRGTKGSARHSVPSDGWIRWTASPSHISIACRALDDGTWKICQFHTSHDISYQCCLHRRRATAGNGPPARGTKTATASPAATFAPWRASFSTPVAVDSRLQPDCIVQEHRPCAFLCQEPKGRDELRSRPVTDSQRAARRRRDPSQHPLSLRRKCRRMAAAFELLQPITLSPAKAK